jgi:hypothetical protein
LPTAEEAFRQSLGRDPSHANALYRLGEFAQSRHDLETAAYYFDRALTAHPGHVGADKRLNALPPVRKAPPETGSPTPRPTPSTTPVARPPRAPSGAGIVGIVRNYQQHSDQNLNRRSVFVLTFRVEQLEHARNGAPPIVVEMRGPELHGSISNGDWVELPERWTQGRPPKQVRNLTTDQTVKFGSRGSHRHPLLRAMGWMLAILMVLWVLAFIGMAVAMMLGADFSGIIDDPQGSFSELSGP